VSEKKTVKSVSGGNSGWGNPSGFAYFLQLVIPRRRLVWGSNPEGIGKESWYKLNETVKFGDVI
jgi:hypothetical protein